jgi:hypothetical protein
MTHELEAMIIEQVLDVAPCAGKEVVYTEDFRAVGEQSVAQIRAEESGAACHQRRFGNVVPHARFPDVFR